MPRSCLVWHWELLGREKDLHQLQCWSSRLWLWACGGPSPQARCWNGWKVLPTLSLQGGDQVGVNHQGGGGADHLGAGAAPHLPGLPRLPWTLAHWQPQAKGHWSIQTPPGPEIGGKNMFITKMRTSNPTLEIEFSFLLSWKVLVLLIWNQKQL